VDFLEQRFAFVQTEAVIVKIPRVRYQQLDHCSRLHLRLLLLLQDLSPQPLPTSTSHKVFIFHVIIMTQNKGYTGSSTWVTSGGIPFKRYSTALSGLLKDARSARSTSDLSYPIAIIDSTVFSNSGPEITRPPTAAATLLLKQRVI
jgi:hypothetical protein